MVQTRAVPIYQLEEGVETFYVPRFEIKISGRDLPRDVVHDVMQVVYRDSIQEIDSFDLQINNWDADTQAFKYVGVPGELEPESSSSPYAGIFDPGESLEVYMGYGNNLRLMMEGQITTLEPNFPSAGPPTLSVRGLNVLHSFRQKQHTWAWESVRDSDVAQELGQRPVTEERPGLDIEVRVDDQAAGQEPEETFLFMNNQYDIVFLMERARRRGYSLYLDEERSDGQVERFLYFGPSHHIRDLTYELVWGQSLVQFRPTLTTANQVSQVTVRGWNRRSRQAIEGTASWSDSDIEINQDQTAVARAIQGRHEVITDRPVHTVQEANALARDILLEQLKEMVKGSGSTVGLPDLRAGRKVHVKQLGPRFSGEYFVTATTHTIGSGGYQTTFEARREKGLEESSSS